MRPRLRQSQSDAVVTGRVGGYTGDRVGSPARVQATPVVRRIAQELGVDLAAVAGTGPGGRVTEDDVRAAASGWTPRDGVSRCAACGA